MSEVNANRDCYSEIKFKVEKHLIYAKIYA